MRNCLFLCLLTLLHFAFVIRCPTAAFSQTIAEELNASPAVDLLQLEEDGVKAAVNCAAASVVQIETIGGNARDAGVSTGTVVSKDGFVLTAAYNLRHKPANIFIKAITTAKEQPERYIAKLLATDNSRNLCLLKIDLPEGIELVPAIAAPEDSLLVGATSIAIGKVHDSTAASISVGIISATGRIWGHAVQTDAKISRSNYGGPLISLSGKTIGVLAPLSPDDGSVEAGAEWYDSGIGFAIPLESYYPSIDRMSQETDLQPGLLGVTLDGEDLYSDVPEIEFCSPRSPASESGLNAGDTITAIDGQSVISQSQMKHVIGPKYAGDSIEITVLRNDQQKTFTATLTDKIEPFAELAIGIIPDRKSDPSVATIAQILPDSPAEKSGLSSGDIISAIDAQEVKTWDDFQTLINQREAGETIEIVVRNESETSPSPAQSKTLELAPLSASLPASIEGRAPVKNEDQAKVKLTQLPIKVAGSANVCTAFLPDGELQKGTSSHSLLVWIAQPGDADLGIVEDSVEEVVTRYGLVVLVPQSLNPIAWSPEEAEFILKAIGKVKKKINIDQDRIAIGGSLTAAKMSCLTAFLNRETFRGLVMFDSLFPRRIPKIETRPGQRLMMLLASSEEFKQVDKLEKMKRILENRKFPITRIQSQDNSMAKMLPQIAAWINALDRH